MGTCCIIKVKDVDVVLYKHFDGYPEATLAWLEYFNQKFVKNRGCDPEYKFAQLIRSSSKDAEKFNLDDSEETGWGVYCPDSIGCSYTYVLNEDGSVTV